MTIRVVVADDHRMFREALRSILEQAPDIEMVGEAANGQDALKIVGDIQPDVIVLDLVLPEMSSMDAAARISARFPKTRIVGLCPEPNNQCAQDVLKAGAVAYVVKTASGSELLRAIRAAAAGEVYVSPEVAASLVNNLRPGHKNCASGVAPLSCREREVLQLLAEGCRSRDIAERLLISTSTIEAHRRNIMRKLNLHTVADLTRYAIREGFASV